MKKLEIVGTVAGFAMMACGSYYIISNEGVKEFQKLHYMSAFSCPNSPDNAVNLDGSNCQLFKLINDFANKCNAVKDSAAANDSDLGSARLALQNFLMNLGNTQIPVCDPPTPYFTSNQPQLVPGSRAYQRFVDFYFETNAACEASMQFRFPAMPSAMSSSEVYALMNAQINQSDIPACKMTKQLSQVLSACVASDPDLDEVLRNVNRQLLAQGFKGEVYCDSLTREPRVSEKPTN